MIDSVILCGGAGQRLWPLSTNSYPKQFLRLFGEKSLLQSTFMRTSALGGQNTYLIANKEHRFLIADQLEQISAKNYKLMLEPVSRNTTAAIASAAFEIAKKDPSTVMLVLSSDHVIADVDKFISTVQLAKKEAELGFVVTLGVRPTYPEVGYGYIEVENDPKLEVIQAAKSFLEKPDFLMAERCVASGCYLWNSGIFLFRADVILSEIKTYAPDVYQACKRAVDGIKIDQNFFWLGESFEDCRSESIDFSVMEKTRLIKVAFWDGEWSDVGSWPLVWDKSLKNEHGNAIVGNVVLQNTHDCYVHSASRIVAMVGVENLVVVETPDAILVANKFSSQDLKQLVGHLNVHQKFDCEHGVVHRPWGFYETYASGYNYLLKKLVIKPGARISVQYHKKRSEHWVVISGLARVKLGGREFDLKENESTFIPVGEVHSIENPGGDNLEVIEVQTGSYLGEDDIVRLDDYYGRA